MFSEYTGIFWTNHEKNGTFLRANVKAVLSSFYFPAVATAAVASARTRSTRANRGTARRAVEGAPPVRRRRRKVPETSMGAKKHAS